MAAKVIVQLPDEPSYAVRIGQGILAQLGQNMRSLEACAATRDVLVLTDSNVAPLYLAQTKQSLTEVGFKPADVVVPAGEDSKSIEVASEIWSALAQLGYGRDSAIVALGGGVVGDLAGFIASTYMRGVPVVQVPTTLLAMVDSSVGGKTAVNLPEGKNLVGTFYQPSFVCADTATLKTLPEAQWRCGCAEIVKSALIDSDDFFFWLTDYASDLAARESAVVAEAVQRCVVFKANVVAQDKTESAGVRECLNYGHTLGHAIELCCGYGTFSHGQCVAQGMRFAGLLATQLSEAAQSGMQASGAQLGTNMQVSKDFIEAQNSLLDQLGLTALAYNVSPDDLLAAMKHDKKARGGDIRFVLVSDIAQWQVRALPDDVILTALKSVVTA